MTKTKQTILRDMARYDPYSPLTDEELKQCEFAMMEILVGDKSINQSSGAALWNKAILRIGEDKETIDSLLDENKRLRDALEFYADKEGYTRTYSSPTGRVMCETTGEVINDLGKKAQEALTGKDNVSPAKPCAKQE